MSDRSATSTVLDAVLADVGPGSVEILKILSRDAERIHVRAAPRGKGFRTAAVTDEPVLPTTSGAYDSLAA